MLDPHLSLLEPIPSSFLPPLPLARNTLAPLAPLELLRLIGRLRQMYLPPIHGGIPSSFAADLARHSEPSTLSDGRQRSFHTELADTLDDFRDLQLNAASSMQCSAKPRDIMEQEEAEEDVSDSDSLDSESEPMTAHLDPFERNWAEKWLSGVIRRAQSWIAEREEAQELLDDWEHMSFMEVKGVEAVLREATSVLAIMAGTSAAGSLTRHLLFSVDPSLSSALREARQVSPVNPNLSPETATFLMSLSVSPDSHMANLRHRNPSISPEIRHHGSHTSRSGRSDISSSPDTTFYNSRERRRRRRRPAIPIILHDAPMADHLGVGVQTWGSAILLGKQMAKNPDAFQLFRPGGVRVLELGAGTGLLSILSRKLLDLHHAATGTTDPSLDLVLATDFHLDVLSNLKTCIDLNFPTYPAEGGWVSSRSDTLPDMKVHVAKLDWGTFPARMEADQPLDLTSDTQEETDLLFSKPFDLVLASDCVYDQTHAAKLRQVVSWLLRLPAADGAGDLGGTFHILSPIRPTFAPEIESIDKHFPPLSSYPPTGQHSPTSARDSVMASTDIGEGLGRPDGLRLGTRRDGKRVVRGRKGEGRADEMGYWWWEIGWKE